MVPFNPNVMFVVVLVLATLFMCGRAGPSYSSEWGYPNPGPVVAPKTFVTHLVSRAELTKILRAEGQDIGADAIAFWRRRPCEIYIEAPVERMEDARYSWTSLMKHEIKHCIYGSFHD